MCVIHGVWCTHSVRSWFVYHPLAAAHLMWVVVFRSHIRDIIELVKKVSSLFVYFDVCVVCCEPSLQAACKMLYSQCTVCYVFCVYTLSPTT